MHNIQDFITIKWSLYLPHKTFHNRPLHLTKTLQKWNNPIKRRTKRTIDAKLWFSIKRYLPGKRSINYPMEHHLSDVWCHQYIVHNNSYLHPVTLMNVIRDLWYVIDSREKKDSIRVSIDLRDTKRPNTSGVVESAIFFFFFFFCEPHWWLIVILSPVFWTSDCDTVYIVTGVVGRQPRAFKI